MRSARTYQPFGCLRWVWSRQVCATAVLVTAFFALASVATAAPVDLSAAGQDASMPQVAVGAGGHTTAVWSRSNGTNVIVQAASRAPGGAWSTPTDLSAPGLDAIQPAVAVDASGNATVVWSRYNGTVNVIQAATRPVGGSWSAPANLSAAGSSAMDAVTPQVAVDSIGYAIAVWSRYDGVAPSVETATRPAGGTWTTAANLSQPGSAYQGAVDPQLAFDANDNAILAWSRSDETAWRVEALSRPAGGAWSGRMEMSFYGQNSHSPQVAVSASGRVTVIWTRANVAVLAKSRSASGVWTDQVELDGGPAATRPQVAMDSSGNATAVWDRFNGTNTVTRTANLAAGGSWTAAAGLSALGQNASHAQVAFDADGNATAIWSRFNGTHDIVQTSTRPAGGAWSVPADLSAPGADSQYPQMALDSSGNATTVWSRFGPSTLVQANGFAVAPAVVSGPAPAGDTGTATPATPTPETTPALAARPAPASNTFTTLASLTAGGRLALDYVLPGPGRLEVIATHDASRDRAFPVRGVRPMRPGKQRIALARRNRSIAARGPATVNLTLSRAARRMLRRNGHQLGIRLVTRYTPTGGSPRRTARSVVVRETRRAGGWVLDMRDRVSP